MGDALKEVDELTDIFVNVIDTISKSGFITVKDRSELERRVRRIAEAIVSIKEENGGVDAMLLYVIASIMAVSRGIKMHVACHILSLLYSLEDLENLER